MAAAIIFGHKVAQITTSAILTAEVRAQQTNAATPDDALQRLVVFFHPFPHGTHCCNLWHSPLPQSCTDCQSANAMA